ncbi:hypothetical protein [Nonomuraea recticatena]|uniref:hypothetical protein n=1 Tax=Nonomuraea recticatena TaxID=46178 RepID=UPI00361590CA
MRDEAEVAAARELIVACGALEAVERRIDLLTRKATAALERAGLPEEASAALAELARQVTDRRA